MRTWQMRSRLFSKMKSKIKLLLCKRWNIHRIESSAYSSSLITTSYFVMVKFIFKWRIMLDSSRYVNGSDWIPFFSHEFSCLLHHPSHLKIQPNIDHSVNKSHTFIPRSTIYNGLYEEAPPKRGIFFKLQAYVRVEILLVEIYKRVRKSWSL